MSSKIRKIIVSIIVVFGMIVGGTVIIVNNQKVSIAEESSQLVEVDIKSDIEKMDIAYSLRTPFDLDSILTGENGKFNTFVFSGKIVDMNEYESSWVDNNGESWGPFSRSVLTVEIDDVYAGEVPVSGNVIRVLYPQSLSVLQAESVFIEKNASYVFVNCWVLDEQYVSALSGMEAEAYEKDLSFNYADVIMGGAWNSLFPIENNQVIAYHEYFDHGNMSDHFLAAEDVIDDKLTGANAIKSGDFVALSFNDFERGFIAVLTEKTAQTDAKKQSDVIK